MIFKYKFPNVFKNTNIVLILPGMKVGWIHKPIAALFIQILLVLILLEIILQAYNPLAGNLKGDQIILNANQKTEVRNKLHKELDDHWIVSTNSFGFRGTEPNQSTNNYPSIVTIGGSTTMCTSMSDHLTWSSHLENALKLRYPQVWLNNAGLNGHSTYGHAIMLRDHISKIKPDMAIFLVGINEMYTNDPEFDFGSANRSFKEFLMKFELTRTILNFYRIQKASRIVFQNNRVNMEQLFNQTPTKTTPERKEELFILNQKQVLSYRDRLTRIYNLCQEQKITPIFVTQPLLFGQAIDPGTGNDLGSIWIDFLECTSDIYAQLLDNINDETRTFCSKNNVHLIDLAQMMPKDSKYYLDGIHFSYSGNEMVAKLIAPSVEMALTDLTHENAR